MNIIHVLPTFDIVDDCKFNEFRCNKTRDECVSINKVCNGHNDCLDGEDEKGCGKLSTKDLEFYDSSSTLKKGRIETNKEIKFLVRLISLFHVPFEYCTPI